MSVRFNEAVAGTANIAAIREIYQRAILLQEGVSYAAFFAQSKNNGADTNQKADEIFFEFTINQKMGDLMAVLESIDHPEIIKSLDLKEYEGNPSKKVGEWQHYPNR